jgi:hypothetical protein
VTTEHGGVGFVMAGCQPRPAAQLRRPSKAGHVSDLGDEDRRQDRSDTGDGLDGVVAAVTAQAGGDQVSKAGDLVVVDLDQFQQRADPQSVDRTQRGVGQQAYPGRGEQVAHWYGDAFLGQHAMDLGFQA